MDPRPVERVSIELTNRCEKACAFCYNASGPSGESSWTLAEVLSLARDLVRCGTRALSFGGGEPLEFEGVFELLGRLRGQAFRSVTTSGLRLADPRVFEELVRAAPDKVHVSLHRPQDPAELERVRLQVLALEASGIASGVNLLVARSAVEAARAASERLRASGIGPERVIYLPLRPSPDAPGAEELARAAGLSRFQSPSCLLACRPSPRFCSIRWDRTAAFCSYSPARARLAEPSSRALDACLRGLHHLPCGASP